ncbi:Cellulase family glycosylhydrolase [Candidatus Electronema halotolerans]
MKKSSFHQILFLLLTITALLFFPAILQAKIKYTGINLSGADSTPSNLPGTYGTDYIYPNSAEIDYYLGKGMNTFRLPFRWERLQQSQNAALDADELARMDAFVDYATEKGAYVILDPHNYQRYYPDSNDVQKRLVGTDEVPDSAFADFWSKLASHYKENNQVIFGLMNEPNSMPTAQLVTSENAAIAAIRDAGAKNLILVPGNGWTGAWSWTATWYDGANSEAMLNIVDSENNFAFEVHQYMDCDSSGQSSEICNNDPYITWKFEEFTNWLKEHNFKGFLAEFAVANSTIGTAEDQIGDEVIYNMLTYIKENSDVWLGWTWWAGGPWWDDDYQFTLEPTNLGQPDQGPDQAAMAFLQPYFAQPSSFHPALQATLHLLLNQ